MDALPHTALAALRTLAGRLIPASAAFGAPGADDDAIFAAIAAALQPALPMLGAFIADLGADEGRAIAERPLDEWLAHLAATHQGAFAVFSAAVIQAYYRDDRVVRSLGQEPRPPFPKGHAIPEGDFSLLAPVRARGPIWRDPG